MCERSFPPVAAWALVPAALRPLAASLWPRLVADAQQHRRVPLRLLVGWRQGYASSQRSKSAALPGPVRQALHAALKGADAAASPAEAEEAPVNALADVAHAALRSALAHDQLNLTRLVVRGLLRKASDHAARPPRACPR